MHTSRRTDVLRREDRMWIQHRFAGPPDAYGPKRAVRALNGRRPVSVHVKELEPQEAELEEAYGFRAFEPGVLQHQDGPHALEGSKEGTSYPHMRVMIFTMMGHVQKDKLKGDQKNRRPRGSFQNSARSNHTEFELLSPNVERASVYEIIIECEETSSFRAFEPGDVAAWCLRDAFVFSSLYARNVYTGRQEISPTAFQQVQRKSDVVKCLRADEQDAVTTIAILNIKRRATRTPSFSLVLAWHYPGIGARSLRLTRSRRPTRPEREDMSRKSGLIGQRRHHRAALSTSRSVTLVVRGGRGNEESVVTELWYMNTQEDELPASDDGLRSDLARKYESSPRARIVPSHVRAAVPGFPLVPRLAGQRAPTRREDQRDQHVGQWKPIRREGYWLADAATYDAVEGIRAAHQSLSLSLSLAVVFYPKTTLAEIILGFREYDMRSVVWKKICPMGTYITSWESLQRAGRDRTGQGDAASHMANVPTPRGRGVLPLQVLLGVVPYALRPLPSSPQPWPLHVSLATAAGAS
ncbi:hypothetical protein BDW22DRAFT_1345081 [Trametopsis cervina]|nr:hypothetical protein BDW22DRAFT_1345081 [Trametopsis cervina]